MARAYSCGILSAAAAPPALMSPKSAEHALWLERWQRFSTAALRAFHAYANWLVRLEVADPGELDSLLDHAAYAALLEELEAENG